jgi:hypothetical protein
LRRQLADRLDHREAGAHRPLGIIPRAPEMPVAELEVTERPEKPSRLMSNSQSGWWNGSSPRTGMSAGHAAAASRKYGHTFPSPILPPQRDREGAAVVPVSYFRDMSSSRKMGRPLPNSS